ncbi:MAG TPA: Cof-type HAD-IIB family hydrolase [Defluviitoga sp.]|nr:Cof-type HAD-IIB family hydrolase [Defluviitoga sp.]HOP24909.1 Cof-type HAD-IIB family hydrolase [Defluviitoga sp.]HPU59958.1 Cof-type HAD-IIB family hydrolase [Defluviitoga tunisiensis]HPZ29218.1 Cof-type HAD-IIB family hydrolase [Defluviitoga sp.]HQD63173.1 Cof-type HAD-IIB family hydrolase [Defluviitoga sp.]
MDYHLNSSHKVFVFDFDGTLLNSEVRVGPRTFEALKILKEQGHTIILCSGRMYASMLYIINNFLPFLKGYAYIVAYNGGYIVNNKGELIFEKGLEKEVAIECVEFLRQLNVHRHIYINDELISEVDDQEIRDYSKHAFVEYKLVDDLVETIKSSEHPTLKILAICEPDRLDEIQSFAEKKFEGRINIMKSFSSYLDFMPFGVSKGEALKILAEIYNFNVEEAYVFGDSQNDIDMLRISKNSFAMGNAEKEVKEAASYVIPSNDEDGVAYALEKILCDDGNNVNF